MKGNLYTAVRVDVETTLTKAVSGPGPHLSLSPPTPWQVEHIDYALRHASFLGTTDLLPEVGLAPP